MLKHSRPSHIALLAISVLLLAACEGSPPLMVTGQPGASPVRTNPPLFVTAAASPIPTNPPLLVTAAATAPAAVATFPPVRGATPTAPAPAPTPPVSSPVATAPTATAVATRDAAGPTPASLMTLDMVSPQEGWAIGWEPNQRIGGVLRTTDGGESWEDVTPPGLSFAVPPAAYFEGLRRAWIAVAPDGEGSGPNPANVVVYRTDDGGQTWAESAQIPISGGGPADLYFLDEQRGWLLVGLGAAAGSEAVAIFRTTDGGATWTQVSLTAGQQEESIPDSLPFSCIKTGLSFVDERRGWATGNCPGGPLFLYATNDGGETWSRAELPAPPGQPEGFLEACQCGTRPPLFVSSQFGALTVEAYIDNLTAFLYITDDGGQNWTPHRLPVPDARGRAQFVDPQHGWITDGDELFSTTDGGEQWAHLSPLPVPAEEFSGLDFVDTQNGWLLAQGKLFVTRDGGQTWQPVDAILATPDAGTGS